MSQPLPAYGTYPGPPAQGNQAPTSKARAIWSLVLAIVPMPFAWIASVVLAIMVLSRSRDGRAHGKGLAISALVVVGLWTALIATLLAVAVVQEANNSDSSGPPANQSGDVSVENLEAGDCLPQDLEERVFYTVEVVPCSEPHHLEVYATFLLDKGKFPGDRAVDRLADGGCFKRFEDYVGANLDDTDFEMHYLTPVADGWSYDRGVTCMVSAGPNSTGSVKEAGPATS